MKITWNAKLKLAVIIVLLIPLLLHMSCASKDVVTSQEQIDLAKAKDFQQAGRYELAIERYANIKNKYPLSPEAVEAELELAETYFLQGSYIEARTSFEAFIDLHPRHEKVDFAAYRTAMCYYKQIPSTIDRDLTPANQAISSFSDFLKKYEKSSYVDDVKAKIIESQNKLAEKEYYIAHFYFTQKQYKSAVGRFKIILKKYPWHDLNEKALFHLGLCYYHQNNKTETKETFESFIKKYMNSIYIDEAKKILKDL